MDPRELSKLGEQIRAGEVALYHGGCPAIRVGDAILPPTVTGAISSRVAQHSSRLGPVRTRRDLVYVTTEINLALVSAASWLTRAAGNGRGWLYRVELEGDVEFDLDEDLPRGPFVSFQTSRARVAAVLDRGVDPSDPRHRLWLEQFIRTLG